VRQQLGDRQSFPIKLTESRREPVALPFAPSVVSTESTEGTAAGVGMQPSAELDPGELQRALRKRIAKRMRVQTDTTLPPPQPAEHANEPEAPPEELKPDLFTERPVVDERFVFTGEQTTQTSPKNVILSPADVRRPNPKEEQPLEDQNLADDGLWMPDLPYLK
jgi:hypothetical protein